MDPTGIHREFLNLQSDCYRSARYWTCREVFWCFIDHVCKFVIFLTSGGAACLNAFGNDPKSIGWCVASAIASFILESFAVQGRISFAVRQCQRYNTILTLFPIDETEDDVKLLKRIRNERLKVEKDETVILECLDVHCHNKQCVAEDRREDMRPMTLWQKTVGRVFPLGYKPPPQGKDQKK